MRLSDKIAIVTGAASGIGRAAAVRFASEGATVFAADTNEAGIRETAELSDAIEPLAADVSSAASVAAMVQTVVDRLPVKIVVLHISIYVLVFQVLIILFTSITGIGREGFWKLVVKLFKSFQVGD